MTLEDFDDSHLCPTIQNGIWLHDNYLISVILKMHKSSLLDEFKTICIL